MLDANEAYSQGDAINREIYLKLPKELFRGELWLLRKTVYGLGDAARAWHLRLKEVLLGVGMKMSKLPPAFFYPNDGGELSELYSTVLIFGD